MLTNFYLGFILKDKNSCEANFKRLVQEGRTARQSTRLVQSWQFFFTTLFSIAFTLVKICGSIKAWQMRLKKKSLK